MLIQQVVGTAAELTLSGLHLDSLEIEWFEATKRIQRKKTADGMDIAIRFLSEGQRLQQDDVLYRDERKAVVVHIKPCEAIVVTPESFLQMGTICYEIGNKHLPMFIQDDQVLIPYEEPLFRWLQARGYKPFREVRKLVNMLRSNVAPHRHDGPSLFTKIITLAAKQ